MNLEIHTTERELEEFDPVAKTSKCSGNLKGAKEGEGQNTVMRRYVERRE